MIEMDCASFILATLLNSGGTFESATKLQKLAFLSIYESGLESFTGFKWHYYGPYSKELQDTVETLTEEGLVTEKSIDRISYSGNEYTVKRLSLTLEGREVAEAIVAEINNQDKAALFETIDKYGNKPLSKILEYVYNAYSPEDL